MSIKLPSLYKENSENSHTYASSCNTKGKYYYNDGFNQKGMIAWVLSGYIAVGSVWPNILVTDALTNFFTNLGGGGGYEWIIGASLGALVHLAISTK